MKDIMKHERRIDVYDRYGRMIASKYLNEEEDVLGTVKKILNEATENGQVGLKDNFRVEMQTMLYS